MIPRIPLFDVVRWKALAAESLPLLGSTAVLLAALLVGLVVLQG